MKTQSIPQFGPLQGVRVVHLTQSIAGPYCACRLADFGADVIWVENPKGLDSVRMARWNMENERRNMRSINLDPVCAEGQEALVKLIKTCDILIDSYRAGQLAKWGLSDEKLHELNPGLIIVHITGFGLSGDPEYVQRSGYDPIAQAFSCWLVQQGFPDGDPVLTNPPIADYVTALQGAFAAVSALYRRNATGKGEVIDVAQFECMVALQGSSFGHYLNTGAPPVRNGNQGPGSVLGIFRCKDDIEVIWIPVGVGCLAGTMEMIGMEYSDELPKGSAFAMNHLESGKQLRRMMAEYAAEHTSAEVEAECVKRNIPCSPLLDFAAADQHPHYKAREVFIEREEDGEKFRTLNIFPKLQNEPLQVWRGAMTKGADTMDILAELGYSMEDIIALAKSRVAYDTGIKDFMAAMMKRGK